MRIGIAGLSCECSTFSPLPTREEDFQVLSGEDLLAEVIDPGSFPDARFVPLALARALPGGRIRRRFYDDFLAGLLRGILGAGPFDGLLLLMHGAASVYGMEDAEGHFISTLRMAVGRECLISASYDLHGNLSRRVTDNLDLLTAYRTAPHVDVDETVARACRLLVRSLAGNRRPEKALVRVPILLPGEQTGTGWEPAAGLCGMIPRMIEHFGLLDLSVLTGYPWADEPRASASVVALAAERPNAQQAAEAMARHFWRVRHEFGFGVFAGSMDRCLERARAETGRPVLISDSGDNPTAGGAGDVSHALGRLLAVKVDDALCAGITDRQAVAACAGAGAGVVVPLDLGGTLDPLNGTPFHVTARVVSLHETKMPSSGRHNRIAVVDCRGVTVVITELRTPFHRLEQFRELGLDPAQYRIIVVKMGYLVPELEERAAVSLLALTPGAVNQDLAGLAYRRLERPIFPLDPEMEWEP